MDIRQRSGTLSAHTGTGLAAGYLWFRAGKPASAIADALHFHSIPLALFRAPPLMKGGYCESSGDVQKTGVEDAPSRPRFRTVKRRSAALSQYDYCQYAPVPIKKYRPEAQIFF